MDSDEHADLLRGHEVMSSDIVMEPGGSETSSSHGREGWRPASRGRPDALWTAAPSANRPPRGDPPPPSRMRHPQVAERMPWTDLPLPGRLPSPSRGTPSSAPGMASHPASSYRAGRPEIWDDPEGDVVEYRRSQLDMGHSRRSSPTQGSAVSAAHPQAYQGVQARPDRSRWHADMGYTPLASSGQPSTSAPAQGYQQGGLNARTHVPESSDRGRQGHQGSRQPRERSQSRGAWGMRAGSREGEAGGLRSAELALAGSAAAGATSASGTGRPHPSDAFLEAQRCSPGPLQTARLHGRSSTGVSFCIELVHASTCFSDHASTVEWLAS